MEKSVFDRIIGTLRNECEFFVDSRHVSASRNETFPPDSSYHSEFDGWIMAAFRSSRDPGQGHLFLILTGTGDGNTQCSVRRVSFVTDPRSWAPMPESEFEATWKRDADAHSATLLVGGMKHKQRITTCSLVVDPFVVLKVSDRCYDSGLDV